MVVGQVFPGRPRLFRGGEGRQVIRRTAALAPVIRFHRIRVVVSGVE